MVGSSDLLPGHVIDQVTSVEHVIRVEPYLLAMTPTEGHNFAMVVGVTPGDTCGSNLTGKPVTRGSSRDGA
ncbi:MAG: hypothetical protein QN117_13250 [Armatimonadota bacterium]|nr:hypothetical protein [Armatimonadota bacterium]